MAKKKKNLSVAEIQGLLAQLASTTARSPETARAAITGREAADSALEMEAEERIKKAEEKAKKGNFLGKLGGFAGTVIGNAVLPGAGGTILGGVLGGAGGAKIGGSDEDFLDLLKNSAIDSAAGFGVGKLAGLAGAGVDKLVGGKTSEMADLAAKVDPTETAIKELNTGKGPGILSRIGTGFKDALKPGALAENFVGNQAQQLLQGLKTKPTLDVDMPIGLSADSNRAIRDRLQKEEDRVAQQEYQNKSLGLQQQQLTQQGELSREGMKTQRDLATQREQGETSRFAESERTKREFSGLQHKDALAEYDLRKSLSADEAKVATARYEASASRDLAQLELSKSQLGLSQQTFAMNKAAIQTKLNILEGKPSEAGNLLDFVRSDEKLADRFVVKTRDVFGSITETPDTVGYLQEIKRRMGEYARRPNLIGSMDGYLSVMLGLDKDIAAAQAIGPQMSKSPTKLGDAAAVLGNVFGTTSSNATDPGYKRYVNGQEVPE